MFVKYLPSELDNEGLSSLFGRFGKIISAKVMIDTFTSSSLGYGYVEINAVIYCYTTHMQTYSRDFSVSKHRSLENK